MAEKTEKLELFVKAKTTLKGKVVSNQSIPKGVVKLHINPEDAEDLKKMKKLSDTTMALAEFLMLCDVHTKFLGKEATDNPVIGNGEASSDSVPSG